MRDEGLPIESDAVVPDWLREMQSRGWDAPLRLFLDVAEPVGPLAAQLFWVMQPASRLMGWERMMGDLANSLETPEGIAALRRYLDAPDHETDADGS